MPFSGLVFIDECCVKVDFRASKLSGTEIIAFEGLEALGQVDIRLEIHVGKYNCHLGISPLFLKICRVLHGSIHMSIFHIYIDFHICRVC